MKARDVLALYKALLRESNKFPSYNIREYAVKRVNYGFKSNKNVTEEGELHKLYTYAFENLEIIKRQAAIGQMYVAQPLVIEK